MKLTNAPMKILFDRWAAGMGRRRATGAIAVVLVVWMAGTAPRAAWGQAQDKVTLFPSPSTVGAAPSISGRVVSVSPAVVDIEGANGETQKLSIETIREVQFGAEPQALRSARAMLLRGRGADARDEVGKIEAADLDGAEPLVLAEVEFVKAAAAGRSVLDAGGDLSPTTLQNIPRATTCFRFRNCLAICRRGPAGRTKRLRHTPIWTAARLP